MRERRRQYLVESLVIVLASIASAGLCASTTSDLRELTVFPIAGALIIPGMALIGALMTLAINDAMRSSVALVIVSLVGSTMYALAIAAPSFSLEGSRVSLVDRGTTYGLLALLLISIFGLLGMVIVWVLNTMFRPGNM